MKGDALGTALDMLPNSTRDSIPSSKLVISSLPAEENHSHSQTYSEAGLAQSRLWPVNTLAITIAANIAETAILTYPACFPDSVVGFVADESKCDVRFVEYLFRHLRSQIQHEHVGTGSVQDNINLRTLDELRFLVPPLAEQQTIAHVLGTLDDKIELNRRMNRTLEAMARAIFQDWFVDFGPTPGEDGGTGILPPRRTVGPVPRPTGGLGVGGDTGRVEVKPLQDCIKIDKGLSYKGAGLSPTGMPLHNLNSVYEGGGYKNKGIKFYKGEFRDRHITRPGDVLVTNTEQGHDRLLIGYAAIVPTRFGEEGLFSHHIYRVQPKSDTGLFPDFICDLLNSEAMHDEISGYATGTTVNMLPTDALRIPEIVVPKGICGRDLQPTFARSRARQESLIEECELLNDLRDNLIPRLVSGKCRSS